MDNSVLSSFHSQITFSCRVEGGRERERGGGGGGREGGRKGERDGGREGQSGIEKLKDRKRKGGERERENEKEAR